MKIDNGLVVHWKIEFMEKIVHVKNLSVSLSRPKVAEKVSKEMLKGIHLSSHFWEVRC